MGDRRGGDDQSSRVYVGGLNESIKKEDLEGEFEKFGKLENVWVAFNPPGFAFVEFAETTDAETACDNLNGSDFMGAKLRVELARGRRRGGGGGGGGFRGGRGGGGFRGDRDFRGGRGGGDRFGGGGGFRGGRGGGGFRGGRRDDDRYGGGRDFGGGRREGGGGFRGGRGGGSRGYDDGDRFRSRSPRH